MLIKIWSKLHGSSRDPRCWKSGDSRAERISRRSAGGVEAGTLIQGTECERTTRGEEATRSRTRCRLETERRGNCVRQRRRLRTPPPFRIEQPLDFDRRLLADRLPELRFVLRFGGRVNVDIAIEVQVQLF